MNNAKKLVAIMATITTVALASFAASDCTSGYMFSDDPEVVGVDGFQFTMRLAVPRIYDNTTSKGYRKYQTQKIQGELYFVYRNGQRPEVVVTNLVNKTHKINGSNIKYSCWVDDGNYVVPRVNFIGNNKTGKFSTGTVAFYLDAEPSYNKGEDDPDNSLLITLAGKASTRKRYMSEWLGKAYKYLGYYYEFHTIRGNVAGTLGCGCMAYGHTSPTRIAGSCGASSVVDDVASVYGSWSAIYKNKLSWRSCDFYQGCCGD